MAPIDLLAIHNDERSHAATRPFGCEEKADLGRQKRVIGGTAVKAEKPAPRSVV